MLEDTGLVVQNGQRMLEVVDEMSGEAFLVWLLLHFRSCELLGQSAQA